MSTLTVQEIDRNGVTATYSACDAACDQFVTESGREIVHIKNGHASAQDLEIVFANTQDGESVPNKTISVPAAGEMFVGPFPTQHYRDKDTGLISLEYSGVTLLTIAVLRVPVHAPVNIG